MTMSSVPSAPPSAGCSVQFLFSCFMGREEVLRGLPFLACKYGPDGGHTEAQKVSRLLRFFPRFWGLLLSQPRSESKSESGIWNLDMVWSGEF